MSGHTPLDQFAVKKFVDLNFLGFDLSITNSSFMMILVTFSILIFCQFATTNLSLVPGKSQLLFEKLISFISNMLLQTAGHNSLSLSPFVITIFIFVLFCNLFGMIPFSFTVTSQISLSFFLAITILMIVIILGVSNLRMSFFKIFFPKGLPIAIFPLVSFIEIFSFLAKPITLSMRLTANMMGGHILLHVLAGFILSLPLVMKIFPITIIIALIGFEIFVSILQAYIFTILTCVYLGDAFNEH